MADPKKQDIEPAVPEMADPAALSDSELGRVAGGSGSGTTASQALQNATRSQSAVNGIENAGKGF